MDKEPGNPIMTSYYHIAAFEEDELIGYIDCISNGVTDAYIQDLMVKPEYPGKGIGSELMNKMMDPRIKCVETTGLAGGFFVIKAVKCTDF